MMAMNCDQVFDVLTRGPFPTGTWCDEPVEAHLSRCADCRRLAEALRPAIELFQEAVDPEESRDLPGYWSGVAAEAQQAAVSYARQIEPEDTMARSVPLARLARLRQDVSSVVLWRMAAMLVVGITLGSLLAAGGRFRAFEWLPGKGQDAAPLAPHVERPRATLADKVQLAALLPVACLRTGAESSDADKRARDRQHAGADAASLQCCTGCHHAASKADAGGTTVKVAAQVAQSCQLCHHDARAQLGAPLGVSN